MRTFTDSEQFLAYMQATYGSANFSKWQSLRKQFYSYLPYPLAGVSQMNFFGIAVGNAGTNRQLTNMPKAGSFGQNHFLMKQINCSYFIADSNLTAWAGTDVSTLYSEFVNGIFQAGEFEMAIGARTEVQMPVPFLYMPPSDGRSQVFSRGLVSAVVAPPAITSEISAAPYADLNRRQGGYMVDPNILIEAEQNFEVTLNYPSGQLPILATGVVTGGNQLYVGIELDGLIFRPQQ